MRSDDPHDPLAGFTKDARRAFVELALSGLFPGEDTGDVELRRRGSYKPYTHQWETLARGVQAGRPAIVTSGTGSGKTESFMLPILATIAAEAVRWPAPRSSFATPDWLREGTAFMPHRTPESPLRPQAVRALLLYPMNALVEDQMSRLRRTLDSPAAHAVMDERFAGNRIFFGRYTGDAPVTGHARHPRRAHLPKERARLRDRTVRLADRMKDMDRDQRAARAHDLTTRERVSRERAAGAVVEMPEETRYLFPSLDGGELVSRWDMQASPPDILVTNTSMLATTLVREVEAPIWKKTRDWLEQDSEACFFLVLDEMHLVRGSAGSEVVGLLRSLIARLGLHRQGMRHKLRILGSSASLPTDGEGRNDTADYLRQFFSSFGTSRDATDAGDDSPTSWLTAVVHGRPMSESRKSVPPYDPVPFRRVVEVLATGADPFVPRIAARTPPGSVGGRRRSRARIADGPTARARPPPSWLGRSRRYSWKRARMPPRALRALPASVRSPVPSSAWTSRKAFVRCRACASYAASATTWERSSASRHPRDCRAYVHMRSSGVSKDCSRRSAWTERARASSRRRWSGARRTPSEPTD